MSFQIIKVILYSFIGESRVLLLDPNTVNIITGASKTGKSAIIHIVNYCLGRKTSSIPEGVILQNVAWFAVHLLKGTEELFVARRNPGSGNASSEEIYIEKGRNIPLPQYSLLVQNTNREGLIALLTAFSGITEYAFKPKEGQTRNPGIANIGKALIYCFQEQSEIANQRILFHRQGETHLPQNIKDYMPFFLGLVGKEHIQQKEELRNLKQKLRILENREAEKKRLQGSFFERVHALIAEAISVGLLPSEQEMPQSWTSVKDILRSAINTKVEQDISASQYGQQLSRFFEIQMDLRNKYRIIGEEVSALLALKSGGRNFATEATEQKARLKSIDLLPENKDASYHTCPLCSSTLDNPTPDSNAIHSRIENISDQLNGVASDIPHIEEMIAKAEEEQSKINLELRDINSQILAIQNADQRIEEIRDSNAKRALVQGRLGLYLETIEDVEDVVSENKEKQVLKARMQNLEELLGIDVLYDRLNSVLSVISNEMTEMARNLELEHSNHPVRLDVKKLTVVADTDEGPIPLERMGSGENWVSLHLITHLVLHRWFVKKKLPIPHFVFFDQPTQAYFPPDVADETVRNTDKDAVERMFRLITNSNKDVGFQVIITEHADLQLPWYQEMVKEKWWDGQTKLVPIEWINK
ncbi:MAG: DUF3732 domain-containing protein [Deltaproteobacteria bacterium]|nr:DUF3732 domain-containing protein [Deltaproteobacteria bacterium]